MMTTTALKELYDEAFSRFRSAALWNLRQLTSPEPEDVLVVAKRLRTDGNMDARRLAERIESITNGSNQPPA